MTLEEAKAKYHKARDRMPTATYAGGRWLTEAMDALDAAVRDVALAALEPCRKFYPECLRCEVEAEIKRLFGKVLEEPK